MNATMKPRFPIAVLLLCAACGGGSSEPPAASPSTPPTTLAAAPSPMGPTVEADVVTVDTAAPSITLRSGDMPAKAKATAKDLKVGDRTIRVETAAAASLASLKPGMRVRVTCSAAPSSVVTESGGAAGGGASSAPPAYAGPLASCDSVVSITPTDAVAPGGSPSPSPVG